MTGAFMANGIGGFETSEDGKIVHLRLTTDQPGVSIRVSLPADKAMELYAHAGVLVDNLIMAGILPPFAQKPVRNVAYWEVGQNSFSSGFTALLFDKGKTQEALILMKDIDALKLADAIEQKVFTGLSVEHQRDLIRTVESARGAKPRLIIGKAGR